MNTIEFSTEAQENIKEAGADIVERDYNDLTGGQITHERLLARYLAGANQDREQGWRDYVTALANAADLEPLTDAPASCMAPITAHKIVFTNQDDTKTYDVDGWLLPDGRVLIEGAGEDGGDTLLASVDDYEPCGNDVCISREEFRATKLMIYLDDLASGDVDNVEYSESRLTAAEQSEIRRDGVDANRQYARWLSRVKRVKMDPAGYNVYRFDGEDETQQTFVGSRPTLAEAHVIARPGNQIQRGLDGEVWSV